MQERRLTRGLSIAFGLIVLVAASGTATTTAGAATSPISGVAREELVPIESVVLARYFSGGFHWVTTGVVSNAFLLPPGHEEEPLGSIPTAGLGFVPLYGCLAGPSHFLSLSATCEGSTVIRIEGYIAPVATGLYSTELFRCRVPANNDHFASLDPNCEGQHVEGPLGFISPLVALTRYQSPAAGRHLTAAGGASPSYHAEGPLGDGLASPGGPTLPLYSCLAGLATTFTSDSPTCEGNTVLGRTAQVYGASGVNRMPLYRCFKNGDFFDTLSVACEGSGVTPQGILGYLEQPILV